jgi:pyoverdine/dityrosine biosynthesis protein Dit1
MIRTNRIFLAANLKDFDMMNPAEFLISKCCRKSQGKMRKEWSIEAANMEKFSWSIGELVNYKTPSLLRISPAQNLGLSQK